MHYNCRLNRSVVEVHCTDCEQCEDTSTFLMQFLFGFVGHICYFF